MSISSQTRSAPTRQAKRPDGKSTAKSVPKFNLVDFIVFLLPLLLFVILLYGMLGWTFYISFSESTLSPNYTFAGLKWYQTMTTLDRFWVDVVNNLKWLILGVIPTATIALFIAYLLELGPIRGLETYTRTLILYPVAMSFLVSGTIWSWMYERNGVINAILKGLGLHTLLNTIISGLGLEAILTQWGLKFPLEPIIGRFTTNPTTATYWLILIFVWQYLGFSVIILQASFRTTELQEMVEAAIMDGASRLRILLQVIVPNIRGGILVLVSLLLISSLKVFDIVYIVTNGGPGYATDVLSLHMLIATFQQHWMALGAGLGVIIFVMAFVVVVPYTIYAFRKWFE